MKTFITALFILLCLRPAGAQEATVMTRDMSWGPVDMTFTASAEHIDYTRDILITFRCISDSDTVVSLPSVEDRLTGFILSGEYDTAPATENGRTVIEKNIRLTPVIASEHRIGPMAISYRENRTNSKNWFATQPVLFKSPSASLSTGGDISENIKPVWVRPSWKEVVKYALLTLACTGFIWVVSRVFRRLRVEARLRRMSPTERALRELDILASRRLPEQSCFKEFYLELTMIVRRYIERAHEVRAPEQTTEEFLEAISNDKRFTEEALSTLKQFLEAADLVKFAAYQPGSDSASDASDTARRYIETDTAPEVKSD